MTTVFLSHSSRDAALARRLALDLQAENVDVWLDQWELDVGDEFEQTIEQGVETADFVLVLLTKSSVTSKWVNREWRQKVHDEVQNDRVSIIPVRGEPCEIPDFLAQRSHADIAGGSYPLGFRHLLTMLRHFAGQETPVDNIAITAPEDLLPDMVPLVTPLALEVSGDLIPIFDPPDGRDSLFLTVMVPNLRDNVYRELGLPIPGVRVRGNETDLPPKSVLVLIDEIPEMMLQVGLDDLIIPLSVAELRPLGIQVEARETLAGQPFSRINPQAADRFREAELPIMDAPQFILFALYCVLRENAGYFLDIDLVHSLVENFRPVDPTLVERVIPEKASWFELTAVLQRLLAEEISIGDIGRILVALENRPPDLNDPLLLTEQVRHALCGQITKMVLEERRSLPVCAVDENIEQQIIGAVKRYSAGSYLDLDSEISFQILEAIRLAVGSLEHQKSTVPLFVENPEVRAYLRRIVMLEFPWLPVLSRNDIELGTEIAVAAHVRLIDPDSATGQSK